jgi:ATP synthase protein I
MAEDSGKNWSSDFGPYLTLGLQLAISVVAFFFLGRWLDGVFDTAPWLMIAGLVLGMVGGFVNFFRTAVSLGKKEDLEAEKEKREHQERKRED